MKDSPTLVWKLRFNDAIKQRDDALLRLAQTEVELEKSRMKISHFINRNNDLWNALARLPYGIAADVVSRLK